MKINENISWKILDNKIVAVNTKTGNYYTMNETASFIFTMISQGCGEEDVLKELSAAYPDTPVDEIRQSVTLQIDDWTKKGLLTI